jgi:hypothetical protein
MERTKSTTVKFDIRELYGKVKWGLPFPLAISGDLKDYSYLTRQQRNNPDAFIPAQKLGKPIWADIELGEVKFALPPIITVSGQLNVVSTAVAGADGSVKEIVSVEDYRVNLKCFLTDNKFEDVGFLSDRGFKISLRKEEFPEQRVREIRNLFEGKKSVRVISPYLNLFNIQYLLVTNMSFPELDGMTSIIPCELQCISDKPLEIKLVQK